MLTWPCSSIQTHDADWYVVAMNAPSHVLARLHAGAMNGQDPESVAYLYRTDARIVRDGQVVGRGPEAAQALLRSESLDRVAHVMELDGEPVIVEYAGPEGRREAVGVVRIAGTDRVTEVRFDHDRHVVDELVARALARA